MPTTMSIPSFLTIPSIRSTRSAATPYRSAMVYRTCKPCTQTLKLYRELGGRVITFGSNSRKPEHLGAHIPEVRERLRNLGFTEFCTYRHMQPVFHAL